MPRGEKPPPVYECQPPTWLPRVHTAADLGFVGFFPPRPDQDEEVLTETNVKNGLHQAAYIPLETYSAQEDLRARLVSDNALVELEDLMNQILARKEEDRPAIPPSSFRLPSRVTLNDTKRQAWFTDLANPDVPLHKLGKSVPHGAKGHDLLDLLHSHNVAIPRAVWFLRVFGGNETVGLRNKPQYNPTQYSVDCASLVTGYMRKQLTEIALPMAPRPGLNIKQTFKGVLAEPESRERWLSKFTYTLDLLRTFYAEGMVDNRAFLAWLVQQTATCNLAQLGFVARLGNEYLDGMLVCHALSRPFVEACLTRITEIRTTPGSEFLSTVERLLKNLVLRVLLGLPDSFVNPRIWAQHSDLLEESVFHFVGSVKTAVGADQNTQALESMFIDTLADIKRRNNAMLFKDLPPRVLGVLSSALSDIKLLNSLSSKSDMGSIAFFDTASDDMSGFTRKLDILLTWSVTPLQYGDHRPYAAVSFIRSWREKAEERALRRGRDSPDAFIQDQLFDWLDSSEVATEPVNLPSIALLFGQFVKHELFSYPRYIQRLIARGEQGLEVTQNHGSRHRNFLRWIPLHSSSSALITQRKVTLYGARIRETPEDLNEREIRKQIRALLPELFLGIHLTGSPSAVGSNIDFCPSCDDLFSATRFEQVRLMNSWLLPVLKKFIANQGSSSYMNDPALKAYCIATVLMARCRCYGTMLELTLFTLEHAATNELLTAVIRTLRQHNEVWACMNSMPHITAALLAAHTVWKARGVQSRPLLNILIELDNGQLLEQAAREQVQADHQAFVYALHPVIERPEPIPSSLPEIYLLAHNPNPDSPSVLANSLWYKYRSAADWAWRVWDSVVGSLMQVSSMFEDVASRRACGSRYAIFLTHVDQHLPNGFDNDISSWFLGKGYNEISVLSAEAWDILLLVLLHLSIHGALGTTTILTGLIYPVWSKAALAIAPEEDPPPEVLLNAVNALFDHLLLQECQVDGLPPVSLYEIQGLQTRRRDVFRHPHFVALAENMPNLVLIEHNTRLPTALREEARRLRETLCSRSVFRLGIYRDLDTIHRAFERLLANHDIPEVLHEALINALRFMFLEGHDGRVTPVEEWQIFSTSLSPWKLAATSIEVRFTIKQLGEALNRDAGRDKARKCLDRLTFSLFGQGMGSEEVDFVADMVKGASNAVVGRFIDSGLRRIADILREQPRPRQTSDYDAILRSGEVLRFLTNLAEPFRGDSTATLDNQIHQSLLAEIEQHLAATRDILSDANQQALEELDLQTLSKAVVLLARVIQFTLCLPGLWTHQIRTSTESLCNVIVDLILIYGSGLTLDIVVFPLLIDTLYYLLDEIPLDFKATPFNPFSYYPKLEMQALPRDMPASFRQRIRVLLPFVNLNAAVAELAYMSKDGSTQDGTHIPVQNRPWEWTEYLGERLPDAKEEKLAEDSQTIKNSASLSLELFGARSLGKRIAVESDGKVNHLLEGTLARLQDNAVTESIFRRDWREGRLVQSSSVAYQRTEQGDEVGPLPNFSTPEVRAESRMASPASSVRSRGSAQPPSISLKSSPQGQLQRMSGSTASDAIDVDSFDIPTTTSMSQAGSKRKATDEPMENDVQMVQGPVIASQKKPKGKVAAKTKPKKR